MENSQRSRTMLTSARRRTKGLKKKLREFTTLCDVEACMVFVGSGGEIETWPEDENRVHKTIQRYTSKRREQKEKNMVNISSYRDDDAAAATTTKMKLDEEDSRESVPPTTTTTTFRNTDLAKESLRDLDKLLQRKMQKVKQRIEFLKSNNAAMNQTNDDSVDPIPRAHGFQTYMSEGEATKLTLGPSCYTGNNETRLKFGPSCYTDKNYDEMLHQSPPLQAMPKLLQLFPMAAGH